MKKHLDVEIEYGIDQYNDPVVNITIVEPESGDTVHCEFLFDCDNHCEIDSWVGNEINSWTILMAEDYEEEN